MFFADDADACVRVRAAALAQRAATLFTASRIFAFFEHYVDASMAAIRGDAQRAAVHYVNVVAVGDACDVCLANVARMRLAQLPLSDNAVTRAATVAAADVYHELRNEPRRRAATAEQVRTAAAESTDERLAHAERAFARMGSALWVGEVRRTRQRPHARRLGGGLALGGGGPGALFTTTAALSVAVVAVVGCAAWRWLSSGTPTVHR